MRRMYFNQLGWIPLVKDALAGYNTSLLAYGQEHENSKDKQISYQCRCSFLEVNYVDTLDVAILILVLRYVLSSLLIVAVCMVMGMKSLVVMLQIKDDTKNGFYVENLTEEYVSTYEDVTQILIKGLSSRKVGSTRVNSKSSRSHGVFTCIINSWRKLLEWNGNRDCEQEIVKEIQGEVDHDDRGKCFDMAERDALPT
nr:kinesin-like protein KIN-12F [Ipomoea trifida]